MTCGYVSKIEGPPKIRGFPVGVPSSQTEKGYRPKAPVHGSDPKALLHNIRVRYEEDANRFCQQAWPRLLARSFGLVESFVLPFAVPGFLMWGWSPRFLNHMAVSNEESFHPFWATSAYVCDCFGRCRRMFMSLNLRIVLCCQPFGIDKASDGSVLKRIYNDM